MLGTATNMNTRNQLAYTGGKNAVFFQIRHQTQENVPQGGQAMAKSLRMSFASSEPSFQNKGQQEI